MERKESSDHIDVRRVAHLARIKLTEDEIRTYQGQLEQIVAYVRKLQDLALDDVEPTSHVAPVCNVFRADEVHPGLDSAEVLRNAPAQSNGQFLVPRIVE